ncbi:MAG TPA: DUF1549 and DUF1553 domain-containing protein, partial [Chthoniobacteraceae bacterium]|nr:DUF1549 and DUF1553 domain-containing protein [Chthoniobacteraceae bacterium]
NVPYPHAWRYRDYVIDAFNRDIPYNRFIEEQIAGDLLPAASPEERDRLATATGFLALGVKDVNQRFKVRFQMDNVDEKIDTVTRSVLGLTVSCARCHDHKFDPVPTADYYALAGIFTSTEDCAGVRNKMGGGGLDYYDPSRLVTLATYIPETPAAQVAELEAKVKEAKEAWEAIRGTPDGLAKDERGRPKQRQFKQRYDKLQADLLGLSDPATRGYALHGVREAAKVADTEIRIRGEAERLGPSVPRGFLTAFNIPGAPQINPSQSGRLELARWLVSPNNPLASRVIVNRVWQHLFGQGLVTTVDNFGVKGGTPSHPELLDYLANQFIEDGWSVKKLIRSLALTRVYQLSSVAHSSHLQSDPANRLVWRHSPRRLDSEEIRDSMLAAAGRLQLSAPSASSIKNLRMVEIRDNGPQARSVYEEANQALYRSVYLPSLRGLIPKPLEAFDPVQQTLVTGQRDVTTVPSQALYLLNSDFVRGQSLAWAQRVVADPERFDADCVKYLYQSVLGRSPSDRELSRDLLFLGEYAQHYRQVPKSSIVNVTLSSANKVASNEPKADADAAANPDDIDRTDMVNRETAVEPNTAKEAAWMNLVQALFASGEFRFVR